MAKLVRRRTTGCSASILTSKATRRWRSAARSAYPHLRREVSCRFRSIKLAPPLRLDRISYNFAGGRGYKLDARRTLLAILRRVLIFGLFLGNLRLCQHLASIKCAEGEPSDSDRGTMQQDRAPRIDLLRCMIWHEIYSMEEDRRRLVYRVMDAA